MAVQSLGENLVKVGQTVSKILRFMFIGTFCGGHLGFFGQTGNGLLFLVFGDGLKLR
jgi:hypothetical protein